MTVTVKIPTQLRTVTGGEARDDRRRAPRTVGEVLDGLYDRYDGLRDRIAEDGDLRRFVNVYVGGEDIRFLDGLETTGRGRRRGHDPARRRGRLSDPTLRRTAPVDLSTGVHMDLGG